MLAYLKVLPLVDKTAAQKPGDHRLGPDRALVGDSVEGPGRNSETEILWELGQRIVPWWGPWVQLQLGPCRVLGLD